MVLCEFVVCKVEPSKSITMMMENLHRVLLEEFFSICTNHHHCQRLIISIIYLSLFQLIFYTFLFFYSSFITSLPFCSPFIFLYTLYCIMFYLHFSFSLLCRRRRRCCCCGGVELVASSSSSPFLSFFPLRVVGQSVFGKFVSHVVIRSLSFLRIYLNHLRYLLYHCSFC